MATLASVAFPAIVDSVAGLRPLAPSLERRPARTQPRATAPVLLISAGSAPIRPAGLDGAPAQ